MQSGLTSRHLSWDICLAENAAVCNFREREIEESALFHIYLMYIFQQLLSFKPSLYDKRYYVRQCTQHRLSLLTSYCCY